MDPTNGEMVPNDAGGEGQLTGEQPVEQQPKPADAGGQAPPQVNWDSPDNPYLKFRDQYAGLQGNFKQVTQRVQMLEQTAAQARQEAEEARAERERIRQGREEAELEVLLNGDPTELQEALRKRVERYKAEQAAEQVARQKIQTQYAPQLHQQVRGQVHAEYENAMKELSEEFGVPWQDVVESSKSAKTFGEFVKTWGKKVAEKQGPNTDELREAILQQVRAELGSQRPVPQAGVNPPPTQAYKDVQDVHTAWIEGRLGSPRDPHGVAAQKKYVAELAKFGESPI